MNTKPEPTNTDIKLINASWYPESLEETGPDERKAIEKLFKRNHENLKRMQNEESAKKHPALSETLEAVSEWVFVRNFQRSTASSAYLLIMLTGATAGTMGGIALLKVLTIILPPLNADPALSILLGGTMIGGSVVGGRLAYPLASEAKKELLKILSRTPAPA